MPELSVVPPVCVLCGLRRTVPPVMPVLTAMVVAPVITCVTFVDVPAGELIVTVSANARQVAPTATATAHATICTLFISNALFGNIPMTSQATISNKTV